MPVVKAEDGSRRLHDGRVVVVECDAETNSRW